MRNNGAILACLLLCSVGCASKAPILRTDTVEVQVPVFVALPESLTEIQPEPPAPMPACTDAETGEATLCNEQFVEWFESVRAWGRVMAGQLIEIRGRQPGAGGPSP